MRTRGLLVVGVVLAMAVQGGCGDDLAPGAAAWEFDSPLSPPYRGDIRRSW